jgi:hypothetical protein
LGMSEDLLGNKKHALFAITTNKVIVSLSTRRLYLRFSTKMGNVCGCESNKVGDVLAKELGGRPELRPSRASLGSLEQSLSSPFTPPQVPSSQSPSVSCMMVT